MVQRHHSVESLSDCFYYDSDDSSISPISDQTPPPWSGTRWQRFFPELSSHFSLVPPASTRSRTVSVPIVYRVPTVTGHKRQSSTDLRETAEIKPSPSSLCSDEGRDNFSSSSSSSSCYSRRTSVTSLGSEASVSAYKSADAFSIISPTQAGVFDDSVSIIRSGSSFTQRQPSVAESKRKPLPREPPIQLIPLSIRRKDTHPATISEDILEDSLDSTRPTPPPHRRRHHHEHNPTLSQAAQELENALVGLTKRQKPRTSILSLDRPLQVSRGNMDMIATRPAPAPPIDCPPRGELLIKASSDEDMKRAKKPPHRRRAFSFTLPGFGRKKHHRFCSEGIRNQENGNLSAVGLGGTPAQRPTSVSSERELRLRLPRLQTKQGITKPRTPTSPPITSLGNDSSTEIRRAVSDRAGSRSMDLVSGPEMVYELAADCPPNPVESPVTPFAPLGQIIWPPVLPDDVVYGILQQCDSLPDLFHLAIINNQFYRVFKSHELSLIQCAIFAMSPAAWELREMSPPWDYEWQVLLDVDAPVPEYTAALYLDRYTQDIYTLVKLKSLILARCGTFLRQETIRGLAGMDDSRASEIDDAFWRVWTFCRIFGCGKGREGDIVGQMDWLNGGIMAMSRHTAVTMSVTEPFGMHDVLFEPPEGFGLGNKGGLSQSQLYDMTEIWTCLGVLLQPMHGRCSEARSAGVYDGHDVAEGDDKKAENLLEEWTYYILTLGPSAVLALGSITNSDKATETFQKAQSMGLTTWKPADSSRSAFFREAVSKAYKPRDGLTRRRSPQSSQTGSNKSIRSSSSRESSPTNSRGSDRHPALRLTRRRQAAYAAQLRDRRNKPQPQTEVIFAEERPISSFGMIMDLNVIPPPPPPPVQPTQIPYPDPPPYNPPRPKVPPAPAPQVRDPVDKAIDMMVRELGFNEEDAKWALKITDTGEGIDANAAVSLLMKEYQNSEQRASRFSLHPKQPSILESVIQSQESLNSGWRWA
ncbi:hypothetical protein AOCH_004929 [Aspergillus ochraceoroseus]|uniref:F-box domain protein n=1 Tax=Aspergillus ochraceoroseus TaxID=138278 RepID=A0A0F8UVS7_9EURO|nr:hypothetical protein AOCH_004929 [Aspergillus ochraceoroseus]